MLSSYIGTEYNNKAFVILERNIILESNVLDFPKNDINRKDI